MKGQTGLPGAAMSTSEAEVAAVVGGARDDISPFRWFTVAPIEVVAVSQ